LLGNGVINNFPLKRETKTRRPLLCNVPLNTSRCNEYATIGCPVLGNVAVNLHATVKEGCFLCVVLVEIIYRGGIELAVYKGLKLGGGQAYYRSGD
jgi:hypothetical protein